MEVIEANRSVCTPYFSTFSTFCSFKVTENIRLFCLDRKSYILDDVVSICTGTKPALLMMPACRLGLSWSRGSCEKNLCSAVLVLCRESSIPRVEIYLLFSVGCSGVIPTDACPLLVCAGLAVCMNIPHDPRNIYWGFTRYRY